MKKLALLILVTTMISCGTEKSIVNTVNYITYGEVKVTNELTVTGILVDINDSIVQVSVNGALKTYNRSDIVNFKKVLKPSPDAMLEDIVHNTNSTAGNTAFFVVITVIVIVTSAVLTVIGATP